MGWTEKDEAKRCHKFLKNGVYAPEDVDRNEFRLLKMWYPDDYLYVKCFLELRHERLANDEWSDECEPPQNDRRVRKYENGEAIVEPP